MINDTINQMVEEGNYALYEVSELKSYLDNLPRKEGVHLIEGISDKERKVIKEITKSIIGKFLLVGIFHLLQVLHLMWN